MPKPTDTLFAAACFAAALLGAPVAGSAQILPQGNQPNPAPADVPRNAPPPEGQVKGPTTPSADKPEPGASTKSPEAGASTKNPSAAQKRPSAQAAPPSDGTQGATGAAPAKAGQAAPPTSPSKQKQDASGSAPAKAGQDASAGGGNGGPDQGYPMKNGGTYKPPAHRPVSPAQDFGIYGRT